MYLVFVLLLINSCSQRQQNLKDQKQQETEKTDSDGFRQGQLDLSSVNKEAKYIWRSLPVGGGGYVTSVIRHPKNRNLIYKRTDVGGVYKWDAQNLQWIPLLDFLSPDDYNFYGIDGIALDPQDENILYLHLGMYPWDKSDIWKSTDGGQSFQSLNFKKRSWGNGESRWVGENLAVNPDNSLHIVVGTRYDGLYYTLDGGKSWSAAQGIPVDPDGIGIRSIIFGNNGDRTLVYASVANNGIWISKDNGKFFTKMSDSPIQPQQLRVASNGDLWATTHNGVFRYRSGTWSRFFPGENNAKFNGLAIHPSNPDLVVTSQYWAGFQNPIYLTKDGGKTWKNLLSKSSFQNQVFWYPQHWQASAISSITFAGNGENEVWFSDWYQTWKYIDILAERPLAQSLPNGHEQLVIFDLISPPNGPYLINACADNGGFIHYNTTEYPTTKLDLQETTGIDFFEKNPNLLARVASKHWGESDHAFQISTDGGKTWVDKTLPGKNGRVAYSATNPDLIVWLPSDPGFVKYTLDRGKSWQIAEGLPKTGVGGFWGWNKRLASDRQNGELFYVLQDGKFFRSEDGGKRFFEVKSVNLPSSTGKYQTVKTAPSQEREVLVTLGEKGLYRSGNAGDRFEQIGNFQNVMVATYGPAEEKNKFPNIFVYGLRNNQWGVYKSQDLGKNWERISTDKKVMGSPNTMVADRQRPGRVYLGTKGRGIFVGTKIN